MQDGLTALMVGTGLGREDIVDVLLNVKDINVMKKDNFVSLIEY